MKLSMLSFFVFISFYSSHAQNMYETPELKAQIKKNDLSHAQAIFKGDTLALDSLMDDDVTVNHPTNRIVKEKQELFDLIRNGVIRYSSFERFPESLDLLHKRDKDNLRMR